MSRQIDDLVEQLPVLDQDFVLLESREAMQPHVENRLRLNFGQSVADARDQTKLRSQRHRAVSRSSGPLDHLRHAARRPGAGHQRHPRFDR